MDINFRFESYLVPDPARKFFLVFGFSLDDDCTLAENSASGLSRELWADWDFELDGGFDEVDLLNENVLLLVVEGFSSASDLSSDLSDLDFSTRFSPPY